MGLHTRARKTARQPRQPHGKQVKYSTAQKEELYKEAVEWIRTNPGQSGNPQYTAACRKYPMLSYATLRRRHLELHQSARQAHEKQMLLTHAQEATLADWMRKDALEAHPWSRVKLKVRVEELCGTQPSDEWVAAFCRRHPDAVQFRGTSALDPKRAQCFNPGTVNDHFEKFGKIRENYRVILNFDETGRQKGGGRKRTGKKYFTAAGDDTRYKARDANLELITIIETCCIDGTMLDPGFILAGNGNYTMEWFEGQEARNISVGLTSNGWTNDEQCLLWFEHVLVPQARAKTLSEDERVLLVFDGHHSHLTDEFIDLGTKYRIDFYLLPAHTTHKLQPLDVACFGPMQREWLTRCEQLVEDGNELQRGQFVAEYLKVRDAAITPDVVNAGWRNCGLYPFNPKIFKDADFAPSRPFSTQAHLPASFPVVPEVLKSTTSSTATPEAMDVDEDPAADSPSGSTDRDRDRCRSPSPMDVDDGPPSPSNTPGSLEGDINTAYSILSSFLPLPGPHFPEFSPTTIPSETTASEKVKMLTSDLARLETLYRSELQRRITAESHCALAAKAILALKGRLADKETKKQGKEKRFSSKAKFLMGPEAMAEHAQQKKEKEAKAQEEVERKAKQAEKEEEERQFRVNLASDPTTEFTGALKGKKKSDLQAVAFTLGLSLSGTNEKLLASIHSCLVSNPQYRSDRRYAKLYPAIDRIANSAAASLTSHTDHNDSHTLPELTTGSQSHPLPPAIPSSVPPSSLRASMPQEPQDDPASENIPPTASTSSKSPTPREESSTSGMPESSMAPVARPRPPLVPVSSYPQHSMPSTSALSVTYPSQFSYPP